MNPVSGYTMTNFLLWLSLSHPEIQTVRDLPTNALMDLAKEFENTKPSADRAIEEEWQNGFTVLSMSDNNPFLIALFNVDGGWQQARDRYGKFEVEKTVRDFENWVRERQTKLTVPNEKDIDTLLQEYLEKRKIKSIDRYIGDIRSLEDGRVYEELTEQLVQMGVKPKVGRKPFVADILERYKNVPLHAVILYTTEDQNIESYISENWGALDTLSGDFCDIHPSVDQFKKAEDAYDFIEKLDVIKSSKFNSYSQLPGIFFWDNNGAAEFIPFGYKKNPANITRVLRTIFEEIHKKPTISSVTSAKKSLEAGGKREVKRESQKKSNIWSDLIAILLAFVVVITAIVIASKFVSALVLGIAFITALLFFVLIITWLLRRTNELSETNFTKVVFRFFDSLPLLRGPSNKEENTKGK